jgi:peptidoglycan L-alanyl-D-glutamate endopeptidase CwlK
MEMRWDRCSMLPVKKARQRRIVVDSRMSFDEAISGTTAPAWIIDTLCLFDVNYYSFDGKLHQGQLVGHRRLKGEIEDIFVRIRDIRFPVAKVIPIVRYDWSDPASMADNNTSCFNYRVVYGTANLSRHAEGMAVDINPRQNPVIYEDGKSLPAGAVYEPRTGGTLSRDCVLLDDFLSRGWTWGGDFTSYKDYHHFEKFL